MRKNLIEMEGGKAVVIDLPLLDVIGAGDATALDLTTDGFRLILSPMRDSGEVEAPRELHAAPRPTLRSEEFDARNPRESKRLIETLQQDFGFKQEHFQRLHHFGSRSSVWTHLNYCSGTSRFSAETNVIVARRLRLCLELRERGLAWDQVIEAAKQQYPFPGDREGF